MFSKLRTCLEEAAVKGRCKRVGKCIKFPAHLKPVPLVHGGDAPTEPLASPTCSRAPRAGVGTAGFQGALSGAEIYTVFDKKKVCFSSSCWQLACGREAAAARPLVFQSHTLQFGSGDQVSRDTGNSPVQGQNILLKYFLSIKTTVTSLRLLPVRSWMSWEQIPHVQHISFYDLKCSAQSSLKIFFRQHWFISHRLSTPRNSLSSVSVPSNLAFAKCSLEQPKHCLSLLSLPCIKPMTLTAIRTSCYLLRSSRCFGDGAVSSKEKPGRLPPKLGFRPSHLHVTSNQALSYSLSAFCFPVACCIFVCESLGCCTKGLFAV